MFVERLGAHMRASLTRAKGDRFCYYTLLIKPRELNA
jgi:hypothetical protein